MKKKLRSEKSVNVTVTMPPELFARLEQAAACEQRSRSNVAAMALRLGLAEIDKAKERKLKWGVAK